jgi:hypothetical protein
MLSICDFVWECEDVASAGTIQLPNPGELQDTAVSLQTWDVR